MKKITVACVLTACLTISCCCQNSCPVNTSENKVDQQKNEQLKEQEAANVREKTMMEEAEKTWESKPPHDHTLEDAQNTARQKQKDNPRYLKRDATMKQNKKGK
jgi:hypothetical protein